MDPPKLTGRAFVIPYNCKEEHGVRFMLPATLQADGVECVDDLPEKGISKKFHGKRMLCQITITPVLNNKGKIVISRL